VQQGCAVLVLAVGLKRDFFPKNHRGRSLLGSMAVRLTLLGAVNAVEADTLSSVVVQDFDGVAIEDRDDGAGEGRREYD